MNKDHNDSVPPNLLNRIQIPQRINLIKPPKQPNTRTRPPIPHLPPGLTLQLPPPILPPNPQKLLLPALLRLAVTSPQRRLLPAKDTPPRRPHRVPEARAPRGLVGARVSDDALDAGRAARVEAFGREVDVGARGGGAHGGSDLGLAVGVFFGGGVGLGGVAVFGVGERGVVGAVYEAGELFLRGGRAGHGDVLRGAGAGCSSVFIWEAGSGMWLWKSV